MISKAEVGSAVAAISDARNNPRRVAAQDSVCIKKSPSHIGSSNLSVASNLAANGEETRAYQRAGGSQAAESAKTWFDDSNKNVSSERGTQLFADEDPPFFLRNKSSSEEDLPNPHKAPPSQSHILRRFTNANSLLSRNQTVVESSSEDFRSVIDDLTIENRKLRKKLKKYEQVHCGDLQSDKLFELRVHGLPASKKRKLEKALQEFASSLGDTPDEEYASAFAQKLARVPNKKPDLHHNASSSSTSNSRTFGDSAYASMSNSSNAHRSHGESSRAGTGSSASANDQAVRSYLQNLSRGLLPKHPPMLTEKAKKQVVVQRLEQLFTGSRDSSGKDSQSKQQQEVSQSAATADRKTSEAQGQRVAAEGRRESKIFASEEEIKGGVKVSLDRTDTDSSSATDNSSQATPDQRPTRPLDLDPSRAQVPEDNIEYMKHLGFGSPQMQAEKSLNDDEGWIYLNLLTGMAQLHILNVTPEFVRNAIREVSAQFELSSDGSRIRWKGGKRPTLMTSDSGEVSAHSSNYSYDLAVPQGDHSKSSKSVENQSGSGSGNNQSSHDPSSSYKTFDRTRPMLLGQMNEVDPYKYKPLFYHDNRSDESGGHSYDDKDSSLSSGAIDSTMLDPEGITQGGATSKRVSKSKIRRGADPIIFYNKAKFYTDLSKDDESMPYNCPLYTKNVKTIIGAEESSDESDHEDRGPLPLTITEKSTPKLERLDSVHTLQGLADDSSASDSMDVDVEKKAPHLFEASGIGGVIPGDNFAIDVKVQLQRGTLNKKVATKVVSSKTTEMLPSKLPPPSYAFLPFSSSSESDSDESDSDSDVEMEDEDAYEQDIKSYIPPKFLNSFSSADSSEDLGADDMSDDSSIDMLAHARELEPETVAAAEREFEENISASDEDEAMDIAPPASSIVATLGDQSFDKDETVEKAMAGPAKVESRKRPSTGHRRAQTGDKRGGKAKQNRTRG